MRYQKKIRKLKKISPDDINDLAAEIYPNFMVVDEIRSEIEEEISIQKRIALIKLIMRSPELDMSIDYGEVIYDLYDYEVNHNQGREFLYWVLVGVAYFAKNDSSSLMYQDYFDYARGLLYGGHSAAFIKALKYLVDEGPLSKFQFVDLTKDFARLNQVRVAKCMEELGKKIFGHEWDLNIFEEFNLEERSHQENSTNNLLNMTDEVCNILNEHNIEDEADIKDFDSFLSIQELSNLVESDLPMEDYLPFVPDMLKYLFDYWDEDRETSYDMLKILRKLSTSIMPELVILGDLLHFDETEVFISKSFGKSKGFSLNHLEKYFINEDCSFIVRENAGLMLMDIAQRYPEVRSNAIDILSAMIADPPNDTVENEELVSSLVSNVLDFDLYELKGAIIKAFDEDRINPAGVNLRNYTGAWALDGVKQDRIRNGKSIFLKCNACGRTRRYGYNYLLFYSEGIRKGFNWDSQNLFIDQVVHCTKCGAVDNYHISVKSLMRLWPGLFHEDEEASVFDHINDDIFFFPLDSIFSLGIEQTPFFQVRQFVLSGNSKKLHPLILGEYYRNLGWFQAALDAYRIAHKKAPEDRICLLMLAAAEHDFGNKEKAKFYYQQVLSLGRGDGILSVSDVMSKKAISGLANLKEGKSSPIPYPINGSGVSLLNYIQGEKKRKRRRH